MVDQLADNTETSSRTSLRTVIGHVDARPRTVLSRVHLPVRFAWSPPDDRGRMVAGCGTGSRIMADRSRRLADLRRRGQRILRNLEVTSPADESAPERAYPRWVGGIAFPGRPDTSNLWKPLGAASFLIPSVQITSSEENGSWVAVSAPDATVTELTRRLDAIRERLHRDGEVVDRSGRCPDLRRCSQEPSDPAEWERMVDRVLDAIDRGSMEKVVLAQRRTLELQDHRSIEGLFRRLFNAGADAYRFLLAGGGRVFIGRSPECLVRKRGRGVRSESIGGTAEAGASEEEKQAFAEQLRGNRKDQREHSLVVRSIRDRLSPFSEEIREGEQTVRVQSNVQHLCTPIDATLSSSRHVLELVEALHPTAAVGGYPRDRALEMIAELETFERGLYGGPVGWFDRNGDGCFAVGIRSGVRTGNRVHLYAGAGIVEGSRSEREWEEVQWKFASMYDLLTERSGTGDQPSPGDD